MTRALTFLLLLVSSAALHGQAPRKVLDSGAGEGPAWNPALGLLFSGAGRITRLAPDGSVHVYRDPSGGSNGLLWDFEGRLIVCEAASRRVTRIEHDGSATVLAAAYEGKQFNSPNDLTLDSRGRIYFSDPRYGRRDGMEILDASGKTIEGVYRIDAPGQVTRVITHETGRPNGVLVSEGDRYLYVAANNNDNLGGERKLWRFDLRADGSIDAASRKLLFDWETSRGPDGLKRDTRGRLYVAGGLNRANRFESPEKHKGGVYILSPEGKLLRFVPIQNDEVTNVAFGGKDWKTLYITAGGTLWTLDVDTPGEAPLKHARPPLPPNTLTAAEKKQGWQLLFDGKSLAGWQGRPTFAPMSPGDWTVQDGAILCGGTKPSWLSTDASFGDFQLKLQFRGDASVNSGVFLRSQKEGQPHVTGYELQIWDYQPQGYLTGSLVGSVKAGPARVKGEVWNQFDITARGDRFTVLLNGAQALDAHDTKHASGVIGFQCQLNQRIAFRDVKLRRIER